MGKRSGKHIKRDCLNARRGLEYQGEKGDVVVEELPNLMVQCKNSKQPSLYAALRQAKRDSNNSEYILLPLRRSGHSVEKENKSDMFCCSKKLFLDLLKFAIKGGLIQDGQNKKNC